MGRVVAVNQCEDEISHLKHGLVFNERLCGQGYCWDPGFWAKRSSKIMETFFNLAHELHNIISIHCALNDHPLRVGRAFLSRDVHLLLWNDTVTDDRSSAVSASDEIESASLY